jgi:hypothetical protein
MLANKLKTLVRQKQTHNFKTARKVGIIFNAGKHEDYRLVKEFGKSLAGLQIEYSILGYLNADIIPDDLMFHGNTSVFCNKDLDFFFRPIHKDALDFMMKKFDMLVDLGLVDCFPRRYITSLSPASFKVGRYSPEKPDLDLMIDIHSKPDIDFLIEQIKNYVSILNNPNESS